MCKYINLPGGHLQTFLFLMFLFSRASCLKSIIHARIHQNSNHGIVAQNNQSMNYGCTGVVYDVAIEKLGLEQASLPRRVDRRRRGQFLASRFFMYFSTKMPYSKLLSAQLFSNSHKLLQSLYYYAPISSFKCVKMVHEFAMSEILESYSRPTHTTPSEIFLPQAK